MRKKEIIEKLDAITKRLNDLECKHTNTHFEEFWGGFPGFYKEVCDDCGNTLSGRLDQTEMLQRKLQKAKKKVRDIVRGLRESKRQDMESLKKEVNGEE